MALGITWYNKHCHHVKHGVAALTTFAVSSLLHPHRWVEVQGGDHEGGREGGREEDREGGHEEDHEEDREEDREEDHGGDLGTSEEGDRTLQVPHYAQFDLHPNQDYPSFASYLAPFSCHQAFVVSLDLQEIP